jgi:rare lipoprotein A (peptidoglycan hydrolase)
MCLFVPLATIPIEFETVASWYGPGFEGRKTASGQPFDQNKLTAASPTLPFGTRLTVKNLKNGLTCDVVINDRGPFKKGRGLDLTHEAARQIGMEGVARVLCSNNVPTKRLAIPQSGMLRIASRARSRSTNYVIAYEGGHRIKIDTLSNRWTKFVHTYRA